MPYTRKIKVVVNTQNVEVETGHAKRLWAFRDKAVIQAGEKTDGVWDVRDSTGVVLDPDQTIGQLGIVDGATLYVGRPVGVGG